MFSIDYRSRLPLYQQIVDNVERMAARGVLQPDSQLPSVRALAVELSLNPNTVSRAYGELLSRGVIYSLPGRGNFVAADSRQIRAAAEEKLVGRLGDLCQEARALDEERAYWQSLCDRAWQQSAAAAEKEGSEE